MGGYEDVVAGRSLFMVMEMISPSLAGSTGWRVPSFSLLYSTQSTRDEVYEDMRLRKSRDFISGQLLSGWYLQRTVHLGLGLDIGYHIPYLIAVKKSEISSR